MKEICPKTPTCAIFNDRILTSDKSTETYKNLYCRSAEKYKTCKRYLVSEKVGKCADYIMPNSSFSVDELVEQMKKKGLI